MTQRLEALQDPSSDPSAHARLLVISLPPVTALF